MRKFSETLPTEILVFTEYDSEKVKDFWFALKLDHYTSFFLYEKKQATTVFIGNRREEIRHTFPDLGKLREEKCHVTLDIDCNFHLVIPGKGVHAIYSGVYDEKMFYCIP